jgi:hypothetical protein
MSREKCNTLKSAGRPVGIRNGEAVGTTPMFALRLSKEMRIRIKYWARDQDDRPTISEAMRRLLALGLDGE